MTENTQAIAGYASRTSYDDFPQDVIQLARLSLLDSVGCALGGSGTELGRLSINLGKLMGNSPGSVIIGDGAQVAPPVAAMVNTELSNTMDYDDTSRTAGGHPGGAIVQGALAVALKLGASGAQLLEAIILGYEVGLRIGEAVRPSPERLREGPVGGWIAFGPAVAAAKLLNLDEKGFERALGIVGSSLEGSARTPGAEHGVRWISDGRPGLYKLGMGLKAFTGVLGAFRATHDFPAPMAILDGHFWTGLGTDRFDEERLHDSLGRDYRIRTMAFKPYPCCRYLHAPLDGISTLLSRHDIRPEEIERVLIKGYQMLAPLTTIKRPTDEWEAQFSLPYTASLVTQGVQPGLSWFDPERYQAPAIQELADKVAFEQDPVANERWFEDRQQSCTVEIETVDGAVHTHNVEWARGEEARPLAAEELQTKFMGIAEPVLGEAKSSALLDVMLTIETVDDISLLRGLLAL